MLTIIITSILIGILFAPLGCVVLWKKYAYFGDGIAHSSILAGVISIIFDLNIFIAGLILTFVFSYIIVKLQSLSSRNASIGLTSTTMLSLALILSYLFPTNINIDSLLFGDLIAANDTDIIIVSSLLITVILFFTFSYKKLILTTLSQDIARTRKINVKLQEFIFLLLLAITILSTIKIVGALLVTSIILIPAMTSQIIAKSPISMILYAIIFALLFNVVGIILSIYIDLPFAPIIICSGAMIYLSILGYKKCTIHSPKLLKLSKHKG